MRASTTILVTLLLLVPKAAFADPTTSDSDVARTDAKDARGEIPIVAYAYTAHGATAGTIGAQAYGTGLAGNRKVEAGGGGSVWASPIDRLTLVADAPRDVFGNFAPSIAGVVRILGRPNDGFSLGALGKFKVEGFGIGPNDEIESEVEGGLLLSYAKVGWHVDLNAITGFGTGDDGEIDGEARLRAGYDLTRAVRLGVDAQGRYRFAGDLRLPGHRVGDFAGGPQLLVASHHVFGALTSGPATMGVVDHTIGWTAMLSFGLMN